MTRKRKKQRQGPVRVGLYLRVSTRRQSDKKEGSLEDQEALLRKAVEVRNVQRDEEHRIVRVYREEAVSGGTLDRPQLHRLRDDIRSGVIDLVVVTKLDRLVRSVVGAAELMDFFREHGVALNSLAETVDTDSSHGRFFFNIMQSNAQMERERTAERTAEAFQSRAERGLWAGGRTPPGYSRREDGQLVEVPDEMEIVRLVARKYVECASAGRARSWLNENGYRQRHGKPWTPDAVRNVAKNPVYRGYIVHNEEQFEGRHEQVFDDELIQKIDSTLKSNQRRRYSKDPRKEYDYLLTGLLFDSEGWAMTPKAGTGRSKRYSYYESSGIRRRERHPCEVKRVRAEFLDEAVVREIRSISSNPDLVEDAVAEANLNVAGRVAPLRDEAERLRATLAATRRKQETLLDRVVELDLGSSRTAKRKLRELEELEEQTEHRLDHLRRQIQRLEEAEVDVATFTRCLRDFDKSWDFLDYGQRQEVLHLLVNKIDIRKDEIVLHLYDGVDAAVALDQEAPGRAARPDRSGASGQAVRHRNGLAPAVGLEPTTSRLTADCSTN